MRFAITGSDKSLPVFDALLAAGWQAVKLFTAPLDQRVDFNRVIVERAIASGVAVQLSAMVDADLRSLAASGCDVLVVAGYDHRVPPWRAHLAHAINFHPSPLPMARGPSPLPRAILEGRRHWAVSCHRVDDGFDTGDLLAQEGFELSEDECLDTLELKVQMASALLASRVAMQFDALWRDATPQPVAGASHWPRSTDADRMLDFTHDVASLRRRMRAFGALEVLAMVDDTLIHVWRVEGWLAAHAHPPGTVVYRTSPNRLVVAVADGYLALLAWSPVSAEIAARLGR